MVRTERTRRLRLLVLLVGAAYWLGLGSSAARSQTLLSPVAVAADSQGKSLYIAEHDGKAVAVFDLATGGITGRIELPDAPNGLVVSPDGSRVYVVGGGAHGCVWTYNLEAGGIESRYPAGHTPMAPVVSSDGAILYVCSRFTNSIVAIDLKSQQRCGEIAVVREPVALAITADGKRLVVANHLAAGPALGDYVGAAVSIIDTTQQKQIKAVALPNGSTGVRGLCLSPDGRYAYATHLLGRYHMPTTQLERGWMNTNALSVIDVATEKLVNTVLLDDVDRGAANPWGVACTADGRHLCVAHAGTHEVSIIDRLALHTKLDAVAAGERVSDVSLSAADVPNDLSFLREMRRRVTLAGNGPRGVAAVGSRVYVAEYFSDSLGVVDLEGKQTGMVQSLSLGPSQAMTEARRGEMLFNDAQLCFQRWQSCASCHPDGRSDGLNWDLLNDGMGNAKNTKALLLAHQTPPVMATGVRDKAETAVRAGIRYIQFAVRPEEEAVAIDAYLKSLQPIESPRLVDGQLSEAARRGQVLFTQAGCATCHGGSLQTDLQSYDVGTGTGLDQGRSFDTPTLVEVWRSAPYLHDGRAASLKEVVVDFNRADKHGVTSQLSPQEIDDLIEFVLSQ